MRYIIGAGILLLIINFMIVPQPKQGEITIDNVPISITTASFEQAWKQNANNLKVGQSIYFEGKIGKEPVPDIQKIVPISILWVKVEPISEN